MKIELHRITEKQQFLEMALEHFRELNPSFEPAADWKAEYFENIQKNRSVSLFWIMANGMRAGFVLYGVEPHRFLPRLTGAIYELYVLPERRREGIAKTCAELVISELWKSSPSKIQLEVVEGNLPAVRLWTSLGFTKVAERFTLARDSH